MDETNGVLQFDSGGGAILIGSAARPMTCACSTEASVTYAALSDQLGTIELVAWLALALVVALLAAVVGGLWAALERAHELRAYADGQHVKLTTPAAPYRGGKGTGPR